MSIKLLGIFHWKAFSMGMKTSGANFQQLKDSILEDLQPKIVVVYIDNIKFFPTLEQHLVDVNIDLERLNIANLELTIISVPLRKRM